MQFRDLQKQYWILKSDIDQAINQVLTAGNFVSGPQVTKLEAALSACTGAKHCVTCANGTDAITLALMVWEIGPGDAVFTDKDEWADLLRSYHIHGKGTDKYDNVRIGINSRLDTLQAAILLVKLQALQEYELEAINRAADFYTRELGRCPECRGYIKTPRVKQGYYSSWAQYSILLKNEAMRNGGQAYLKERGIPTMVYYPRPMSRQTAFEGMDCIKTDLSCAENLCKRVLSLPLHPYITEEEQGRVVRKIKAYILGMI